MESVIGLKRMEVFRPRGGAQRRCRRVRHPRVGPLVKQSSVPEPLGYFPPSEYENPYHSGEDAPAMEAGFM